MFPTFKKYSIIPNVNGTIITANTPMTEVESECLYCDTKFIAIEHKSGECPNCKEKYEWDFDGDYGEDSVYGLQWTRSISPNFNQNK